jgi:Holliday junction resolvase RusA-like endonuclease
MTFTIPTILLKITAGMSMNSSLNAYIKNKKKQDIMQATALALNQSKSTQQYFTPVSILIRYDSQLDIDNHGFVSKAIIDALKDAVLGGEDNKNHVVRLTQEFYSGKGIEVTVEPIEGDIPRPSAKIARRYKQRRKKAK